MDTKALVRCVVVIDGNATVHRFAALPRVGEHVLLPSVNVRHTYVVKAVRHDAYHENALEPGPSVSLKLELLADA